VVLVRSWGISRSYIPGKSPILITKVAYLPSLRLCLASDCCFVWRFAG
jgi:hypothetical protein